MRVSFTAILLSLSLAAAAQTPESLQTIIDRGYVRQWLVVGPFAPDVEGGIAQALRESRPRLGDSDYLASIGGIRRARPRDQLAVSRQNEPNVLWQQAPRTGPGLNLTPLLGDETEAVGYAAFYTVSDRPETVMLEVDSTLGVRVAHNGAIVHDIANVPAADLNTEWIVLQMRTGANVIVFELPGATLDTIAAASSVEPAKLTDAIQRSRPMLTGQTGFQLGVRVHPVEQAGTVYVIPELLPTGAFTGTVREPRKEVALRVYNSDSRSSQSITATLTRLRGSVALRRSLGAVPPQKIASMLFEVPLGGATPGSQETVSVEVVHGNAAVRFRTALSVEAPPEAGTVAYVLRPAARDAEAYLPSYRANALLTASVDEFGFNLGPGYLWRAGWARFPEVRDAVSRAVLKGRIAADTGYAEPDARFADSTLLVRNLQIGRAMSESFFADWSPAYIAWDQPALPWRFADIYDAAGGEGLIDNLDYPGREPLSMLGGPGGASIPVRHKRELVDVISKPQLRDTARLQRTETTDAGLHMDVLIGAYSGMPDPFWADDSVSLGRSVPSIDVTGAGGRMLFEGMPLAEREGYIPPAAEAPAWLSLRPGELVAQPATKTAHARTLTMLKQAEIFATLAGVVGSAFPDETIDAAWRDVLWASESDRLGFANNVETLAETLSAYRRAAEEARGVRAGALAALARVADTYTEAPTRAENVQALVVFNSASFPRTDRVQADIELDQLGGFRLIDSAARPVQYVADEVFIRNQRITRMRFSFVAKNVPAYGYTSYYIVPDSRPIVWGDGEGTTIENDWFTLTVDPRLGGKISSLVWKETGYEFAPSGLNDVVSRTENAVNADSGREIAGDGGVARASAVEATVRKRVGPGAQRLEITEPFGGGKIVRTLTLYNGLDRVYCTLRLEGVRDSAGLVGVEFPAPEPNSLAAVGDGLGIRVARVSAEDAPFETQGANQHGRAFEPANGWFYMGPGDAVRGGQDTGYPLRPARIVLADDAFADAADRLARAFASIGVPADYFDVRPHDNSVYTDADRWTGSDEAEQMGEVLWVVIGDPQAAVLGLLPGAPGTIRFFARGFGQLHGPVLGLYGGDPESINAAAATVSNAITESGALALEGDAIQKAVELPNAGLAVFTDRSSLVSFDPNRATWLVAHGGDPDGAQAVSWADGARTMQVDYAIAPVTGDWRSRSIPQKANAFANPLIPVVTGLHLGAQPAEHSYLTVSGEGILASGLRPASMKAAAASIGETHPRDGLVLNVAEVDGREGQAAVRFGGLGFDAGRMNATGIVEQNLRIAQGSFNVDMPPNGFTLAGFRPAISGPVSSEAAGTGGAAKLRWTRPWEHGRAALPRGGLPVTLEFREPAPAEKSSVVLVIANNRSDAEVSGTVRVEASEGWAVGTSEIDYDLEPRASREQTLLLLRGHRPDTGYLLASTTIDGVEYVDVWPRDARFNAVAERRSDEVQVKIENTSAIPLVGVVELICEPGQWPELGHTPGIAPREYALRVNPYETRRTLFTLPSGDWQGPLVAKVAFNDQKRYLKIETE